MSLFFIMLNKLCFISLMMLLRYVGTCDYITICLSTVTIIKYG